MKTRGANKKPVIEVVNVIDADTNSFELVYTVKEKSSDKGTVSRVGGPFDERFTMVHVMRAQGEFVKKVLS